ncbi:Solute carrier family 35 member F4 [Eumeta japonica]|uniref:Solute carrier family 35 member F4 n=1 Tax=Eumeta variegata TaxID=151549 RepID=A0A4C1TMK3_EUMVA|nr:Solute carrier family 35 member F4 [Eumeta japonica]
MARDGDLATIFHPKRVRAPSVIITSEEVAEGGVGGSGVAERANGPPTPLSPRTPLTPQTSISSAPPLTTQPTLQQTYSESATSSQEEERLRDKKCPRSCCSKLAKKMYYGMCVTVLLTVSWVISTHSIKYLYLEQYTPNGYGTVFSTEASAVAYKNYTLKSRKHIVAAILCDTGIALLAYMDGITGSSTLGGVVLAAFAAAGFAIFKVLFRKIMGEVNTGQRGLFFSIVGLVNASLLWPVCLALYLTGSEMLPSHRMPWIPLLVASVSLLVFHLVYQFGNVMTYNMFVTLGLITAVPVSAALDVVLYEVQFEGMKLAGVILIGVGFFLVMFPDNWPDYIMRLLRWSRRRQRGGGGSGRGRDSMDYRTGYIRSHLRSPSGRVR